MKVATQRENFVFRAFGSRLRLLSGSVQASLESEAVEKYNTTTNLVIKWNGFPNRLHAVVSGERTAGKISSSSRTKNRRDGGQTVASPA